MNNWCILRTAPSRTLTLAAALVDAGFVAWTPQENRIVRVSRCRDRKEVPAPMTPTIVFSEYDRVPELVALSRSPLCRLPSFHVFRHLDVYPRVADRALDALRLAEQRGRPRALARVFHQDEAVKFADAGFEGLIGRVDGVRGRYTLVTFPGFKFPVKIPAHSLMAA
jgi:hypothetical protein